MKVHLRHAKARSYYSGWRCWTDDLHRAVEFQSAEQAIQRAREEQMNQVEVVIRDGDLDKETIIPVVNPAQYNSISG